MLGIAEVLQQYRSQQIMRTHTHIDNSTASVIRALTFLNSFRLNPDVSIESGVQEVSFWIFSWAHSAATIICKQQGTISRQQPPAA